VTSPVTGDQLVVPTGTLVHLTPDDLRPSANNPRQLFDPEPLQALYGSIREHGVLVPLTVYRVPGQTIYAILDGERRYRCAVRLQDEGVTISIPANIVDPPDATAALLYMFSIHNFREPWELMPAAMSLKLLIDEVMTDDPARLKALTGLSDRQIERCLLLLKFDEKYQLMSLALDPRVRIPSNFWIELAPVLDLYEGLAPAFTDAVGGRNGLTDIMIDKYRHGQIKSVVNFRRILEAYDLIEQDRAEFLDELQRFASEPDRELRVAFDRFIGDQRRVRTFLQACEDFVKLISRTSLEHVTDDRPTLIAAVSNVLIAANRLRLALEGDDPPIATPSGDDD